MKIKTYKYIIFYLIVLFLSFFIYKNFSNFKNYIQNIPLYNIVDSYKTKNAIVLSDIGSGFNLDFKKNKEKVIIPILKYSLTGLKLGVLDKSNILLLSNDFDKAEQTILNKKEYDYEDYYNLANIYLLKSNYLFKNNLTSYVYFARKSISYYNTALELIPSYKKKYFILNNLNLAKKYLKYLYFYDCNKIFLDLSNLTKKIQKKLDNINEILDMQLVSLKKWENDNNLKQCILDFKGDIFKNKQIISLNNNFLNLILKGIYSKWKKYVDNYDVCYQNRFLLKDKYFKSLDKLNEYFSSFEAKQSLLLDAFLHGNKADIEKMCNMRGSMSNKQNKENKEIIDSYKKLKDLLPKKEEKKQQPKKGKKQDKKGKNTKNKKEEKKLNKKKLEEIYKNSKDTFKRLQDIKTKTNYDPDSYIKKIFKRFFGNEKDFLENKKKNTIGK